MTQDQTTKPATDWPALWAGLRVMDGDQWDAESDRLDELWKAEYKAAFVAFALTRKGWNRENAEVWADEIAGDALGASMGADAAPVTVAQADVLEAELDTANA